MNRFFKKFTKKRRITTFSCSESLNIASAGEDVGFSAVDFPNKCILRKLKVIENVAPKKNKFDHKKNANDVKSTAAMHVDAVVDCRLYSSRSQSGY
jgi:hypothetical protein